MKRWMLLALSLCACDVEVSLGDHDASIDAPPPACHATPDAGACGECQASACCDAYIACAGAPNCACIVDCTLHGATIEMCTTHCGGADHGEHAPLLECIRSHCSPTCG